MKSLEPIHAKSVTPLAYGIKDAVKVSGLGSTTLYEHIRTGRLRSTKVGRRRLILREDLLALLSGQEREERVA